ncbi:ABC-F family ATP-binding cassette domain-containing protein [Pedobacter insulae]|uniref:ATPase components of ABC transporters with duplicated ATPase domains n=1 Tax=Pedobacter insulae TaxID=414048 RepID=A0A1I2XH00_9SPHI|nr:ABC-F family ATP-binding cassette domain-containing protein [Pedobacter insulae]SFH12768.1 ATPase components of ABC transporters with duplicated ATPase domains [Pedobacter insulae]
MLILQGATYTHPNRDLLFDNLNLTIHKQNKVALVGHNGVGKSTLLKILSGNLQLSAGVLKTDATPYFVPQLFAQYNEDTIAKALGIEEKIKALYEILSGNVTDANLSLLDDDWTIEERCATALKHWDLKVLDLNQKIKGLSGGQKMRVFLAGMMIHQPKIVLLDEPSNHLDIAGRTLLYEYIKTTSNTLVVVSHDRTLLNLLDTVCELSKNGITRYGGNYDFYLTQKRIEQESVMLGLKNEEKALRKAKDVEKASLERQQKLDARGKKKQEQAGLSRISMNTLRNNAEKSTSKLRSVHAKKIVEVSAGLKQLRTEISDIEKMKVGFDHSLFNRGKVLIKVEGLNFTYDNTMLWPEPLTFSIGAGERVALKGANGSGKTTFLKLLLGQLLPQQGTVTNVIVNAIYIDQDYALINNELTIYEQAQLNNAGGLQEHEVKILLNRFLFTKECWGKPCLALSGGEKMRLMLCCLTIAMQKPEMIILDEPTNNLDIQNLEILKSAILAYEGVLLVVSHDEYFLRQINIERSITLI